MTTTATSYVARYLPGRCETPTVSVAGNAACERRFPTRQARTDWVNSHRRAGGLVFEVEDVSATQKVSEVPGQPGRVITGSVPRWSHDSGEPDPIARPSDPFAGIPGAYDDEF